MNTGLHYQYRDAANFKEYKYIIVEGQISLADLKPYLFEGAYFIPWDVGLEELQHGLLSFPLDDDDHVWHELQDTEVTDEYPTEDFDAQELLTRFKTAHEKGWDEKSAMRRLGL